MSTLQGFKTELNVWNPLQRDPPGHREETPLADHSIGPRDGKALQEAILANPADDVVRLAYADWLEENGHVKRSEFIRLQIRIACVSENDAALPELRERQAELLNAHGSEWARALAECEVGSVFCRGFVERIKLSGEAFAEHADELFRLAPIRGVELVAGLEAFLASPHSARVRELYLWYNGLREAGTVALAGSPYLSNLTTLVLWGNGIGDGGARALAGSPNLASLRTLDLWNNGIGDGGARALAASPLLAELTRLDLRKNRVSPAAEAALRARFGEKLVI
jgi:uncharacterized protein (TIGR02996 family)